jgi:lipid-A-disaccharide synthase
MRAYIDHVLALLPFEPAAHRRLGGPACTYVGHPLVEQLEALSPSQDETKARTGQPSVLLVLPGSRRSEIEYLLDVFGTAIGLVAAAYGPLDLVLPAVPHLRQLIIERTKSWPVQPKIIATDLEKYACFRTARAALAASGTVTLELALAGVPQCVGYKVSWVEGFLRYFITVPSIVLPNLILGRNVIPEFLQEACTPQSLAEGLIPLLKEGAEREAQIAACKELREVMLSVGNSPSERAADIVLAIGRERDFSFRQIETSQIL